MVVDSESLTCYISMVYIRIKFLLLMTSLCICFTLSHLMWLGINGFFYILWMLGYWNWKMKIWRVKMKPIWTILELGVHVHVWCNCCCSFDHFDS